MNIANETVWKQWQENNKDEYGSAIIQFAERWADIMEIKMNSGCQLKDIANEASHKADTDGITGYMFGAAVAVLTSCWKHGEELRMWHNEKYHYSGKGVVNPAILTI